MSDYPVYLKMVGVINYTGGKYEVHLVNNLTIKTSNIEKIMIVVNATNA